MCALSSKKTAIVFAYHNVGVRCLEVLLARPDLIDVKLVVTHQDNPNETIWFESVEELALRQKIPVITPENPNTRETMSLLEEIGPDFIFSFYYRHMLDEDILYLATEGALNMHGSLLPKYRGRVPINWAILLGESQTGATLHYMTGKPDAGDLVDQEAISILPDDTALIVFQKVTYAAERILERALPELIAGTAPRIEQDLSQGSYYSGRKPEDGMILWEQYDSIQIHNLVRAVAPPYPGAWTTIDNEKFYIYRTRRVPANEASFFTEDLEQTGVHLFTHENSLYVRCVDGKYIEILEGEYQGESLNRHNMGMLFGL